MFREIFFNKLYIYLIVHEIKYNSSKALHALKIMIIKL